MVEMPGNVGARMSIVSSLALVRVGAFFVLLVLFVPKCQRTWVQECLYHRVWVW